MENFEKDCQPVNEVDEYDYNYYLQKLKKCIEAREKQETSKIQEEWQHFLNQRCSDELKLLKQSVKTVIDQLKS